MAKLQVLLLLLAVSESESESETSLGESFNIHKIRVDGLVVGGREIFPSLQSDCFLSETLQETTKNYKTYSDHEDFVHEIASSVGLTAKELGIKSSINAKYLKKSSTATSGLLVEVIYLRATNIISDECLEEARIDPDLLRELGNLPYPIRRPHLRASWRAYDAFIYKWGSHILKSTQLGAKATYHMSKTKKSVTDKKELLAKVCSKLPELNLDGCVDVGPKTSQSTVSEDETNDAFVLGGTGETQNMLREGHFTKELLDRLSGEAEDHAVPIKNTWLSLPELLNSRITIMRLLGETELGLEHRSVALLSYYKGYHVFGCEYEHAAGEDVTVFVNVGDDDYPIYQCHQIRAGCQSDSDCKNWPLKYLGPCYCAGATCMALVKETKPSRARDLAVRMHVAGQYTDRTNNRCYYSRAGCSCDTSLAGAVLEEVWPLGSILLQSKKPATRVSFWKIVLFSTALLVICTCFVVLYCHWLTRSDKDKKLD